MNKIKTVKIKNEDGSISEESYPISVNANLIDMSNGYDLQETIGNIDVNKDGSIAEQLEHKLNDDYVIDNLESELTNKALSANQGRILNNELKKKAYFFNTVADMKKANLKEGDYVSTLGYYEANDGGKAEYYITSENSNSLYENLKSGLYASLILKEEMNLKQFGIHEDDSTDDSDILQNIINIANTNNISLIGNNKNIKITKTIEIPAYLNLKNCKFKIYSGTYVNSFAFYINANDSHNNWRIQYPEPRGKIENCIFTNATENEYNCIYNFSNGSFENLMIINFNKNFINSTSYLDSYSLSNIFVKEKIGNDYAISLGYLGDQVKVEKFHILTNGINGIDIGAGHNGIILKDIICHGNINATGSNIIIENLHMESGASKIIINNSIIKIINAFLYHNTSANGHNIEISNKSKVILENIKFNYRLTESDLSSDDYDVTIASNSTATLINCYKRILVSDIAENNLCIAKTNISQSSNENQFYSTFNNDNVQYGTNQKFSEHGAYYSDLSGQERAKWKLQTGTYYYCFKPMADFDRMIGYAKNINKYSKALTQDGSGYLANLDHGKYRVYRGTTENLYDHYVDIEFSTGSFIDNGNYANGYLWKSRTPADVDSSLNISRVGISYIGENIIANLANLSNPPTLGTWKRGDKIIKNSISVSDTSIGWLCIEEGTSGVWITIN